MMTNKKIAIVGFGSIGERHSLNINRVLKEKNYSFSIDLIRSKKVKGSGEVLFPLINNIYYSFEDAPNDYDVIFVTNPTHLHYDTIKHCVPKTQHMFIEKPVFNITNLSVKELKLKEDGIYYVACPLRYTNVIQYLKQELDLNQVYSARIISSSYLPDWRPNIDYRKTYSAHFNEGGGVSLDLIHEWDYVHYLFGAPEQVHNFRGKYSNLEIDSDDLSVYIAKYKTMVVEIHLDYFGKKTLREITLLTDKDTIVADIFKGEISYLNSGKTITLKQSRNDYQCKEIEFFFDAIEGKVTNNNDILFALKTLQIAQGEM